MEGRGQKAPIDVFIDFFQFNYFFKFYKAIFTLCRFRRYLW